MIKRVIFISLALIFLPIFAQNSPGIIPIWNKAHHSLSNWESKDFKGHTAYHEILMDKEPVIEAISNNSASGIYKKTNINIKTYPYLNWKWRIQNRLDNHKEATKSGDDFAARIYVIASTGFFFWNKKVICYVWASHEQIGSTWPNPYTGDSVIMYVLQSNNAKTGTWYAERRNIYHDFQTLFNTDIDSISSIAIMTDTDNTEQTEVALYADLFFSKE